MPDSYRVSLQALADETGLDALELWAANVVSDAALGYLEVKAFRQWPSEGFLASSAIGGHSFTRVQRVDHVPLAALIALDDLSVQHVRYINIDDSYTETEVDKTMLALTKSVGIDALVLPSTLNQSAVLLMKQSDNQDLSVMPLLEVSDHISEILVESHSLSSAGRLDVAEVSIGAQLFPIEGLESNANVDLTNVGLLKVGLGLSLEGEVTLGAGDLTRNLVLASDEIQMDATTDESDIKQIVTALSHGISVSGYTQIQHPRLLKTLRHYHLRSSVYIERANFSIKRYVQAGSQSVLSPGVPCPT